MRAAKAWLLVRKAVQTVALVFFLALFVLARDENALAGAANPAVQTLRVWMLLDPLLNLANLLARVGRAAGETLLSLPAQVGLLAGGLGFALLAGRAWCGWLCPLGTLLDWVTPRRRQVASSLRSSQRHRSRAAEGLAANNLSLKVKRSSRLANGEAALTESLPSDCRDERRAKSTLPQDNGWRAVKFGLLAAVLLAALGGGLSGAASSLLAALDPLTLLWRALATCALPGLDWLVSGMERLLYRVEWLAEPLTALDMLLRPALLPTQPLHYPYGWAAGLVLLGVLALNWIMPRFWCRYLCPLGGLLGLVSRKALLRRSVSPDCTGCGVCAPACPTGTIDPQTFASAPAECTLCLDCLEACPRSKIVLGKRVRQPAVSFLRNAIASTAACPERSEGKQSHRCEGVASSLSSSQRHIGNGDSEIHPPLSRRAFLAAAGTGLLAFGLALNDWRRLKVLPPGEKTPAGTKSRLLNPPGAPDPALPGCICCEVCLRACPTGALQPYLGGEAPARLWTPVLAPRLGYCDYSCNACGQACPVGAIPPLSLEEKRLAVIGKAEIDQKRCIAWEERRDCIVCEEMCPLPEKAITLKMHPEGYIVQVPEVNRDLCIGCGICENKCPVEGESAIIVYRDRG